MNLDLLKKQIAADRNARHTVELGRLQPIYFDDKTFHDVSKHFGEIIEICRRMWTILGFSGLITPWHEVDPQKELSYRKGNLQKWFVSLEDMDVSVEAYCVICCSVSDYTKHERPSLLLRQVALMSWVKKLREHAGSKEKVDKVAKFIEKFLELQVSKIGRAYIKSSSVVKHRFEDKKKKWYLDTYHRIADRISYLDSNGIDYNQWMEKKFDNCLKVFSDDRVYITHIVNVNSFDPDFEELLAEVGDPWNNIRRFLELPSDCKFPDGFIPKGWGISSDDSSELKNIAKIMGDGF